ncbi:unnamed protein product, partial [Mesorhabditis belari]|uniref:Uncharacterized protein n=1 Tax=Mesorhabditis belari TaxID=2138241 RepID=A0AAF3FRH7_9BILA
MQSYFLIALMVILALCSVSVDAWGMWGMRRPWGMGYGRGMGMGYGMGYGMGGMGYGYPSYGYGYGR